MADLSSFPIARRWPAQHPDRLQLYSLPTPNGVKVSIMLEETGLPYEPHTIDIMKNETWGPEFLSLNPNGKIPAILDPDGPGGKPLGLFESGAILLYLAEKTGKLLPKDPAKRYEAIQWVMFQMGGIGPIFGQLGFFHKFAGKDFPDKRPLERYANESKRLLGVLESRLAGRDWLADEYSIADIASLGWVRNLIGFYDAGELVDYKSLKNVPAWLERGLARPAVQRGLEIPEAAVTETPAMKIREFGVEIWMNEYETRCAHNLAETCVESLTVAELLRLAGKGNSVMEELLPMKLTYGAIEGSDRLRSAIAALYAKQAIPNITVTHGAIGANALVHETLVEPGDRVVAIVPTYQQHYSIPESYGADLRILKLREEHGYLPDLDELRRLCDGKAKLIAFANPNNPTGSLMDAAMLGQIVAIAEDCGAWILSDEVYRGTDQAGDGFTASVADLYAKGISTGSMSKTYSLAGLRLGWIAAPVDLIRAVSVHRDYNTISVSMLDDHFAAIALEARDKILARSRRITRGNLAILDDWVKAEPRIDYVKPQSGTTALLKLDAAMTSRDFCIRLLDQTGVMLTPGSVMDMEGHLRIGYANNPAVLKTGLSLMSGLLKDLA